MNKSDLTNQLSLDEKSLDTILEAVGIAKNSPEYSDEQLKMIQKLQDIRKDSKVKSWTEAAVIYRKPFHEHQLQEIAMRYCQTERIAEITAALKLKLGSMNEEQFAAFQSVCEQVQQGMDLGMVAHAVLEQAKANKSKKTPAQPEVAPSPEPMSAIAQANGRATLSEGIIQRNGHAVLETAHVVRSFPAETGGDLLQTADKEAVQDQPVLIQSAAEGIFDASDQSRQQAYEHGQRLYFEALGTVMADEAAIEANKAVIEQVKKRRRPARYS